MDKSPKMPKWRTVLGGIIGFLVSMFVISFILMKISLPETIIGILMLVLTVAGLVVGFLRDYKRYCEKYPDAAAPVRATPVEASRPVEAAVSAKNQEPIVVAVPAKNQEPIVVAETVEEAAPTLSAATENAIASQGGGYITSHEFKEIYKSCINLFSIYSADEERYVSYITNIYMDKLDGSLLEESIINSDPFSLRAGAVSSSVRYISYGTMHDMVDNATKRLEDLDAEVFKKLTGDNREKWLWENVDKKYAMEVKAYLGKETVTGQGDVEITWRWLCREYESKKYKIISESKTYSGTTPNLSKLQELMLQGESVYLLGDAADAYDCMGRAGDRKRCDGCEDIKLCSKIKKGEMIDYICRQPITANMVREGMFSLVADRVIRKKDSEIDTMILELNIFAREYCGFDRDIVFDNSHSGKSEFYLERQGTLYDIYQSNTLGEKIRSRCGCSKTEARAELESRIFRASDNFVSFAGGDPKLDDLFPALKKARDKEYAVYEIGQKVMVAGQGDITCSWTYTCKDLSTDKMIRVTESINKSVYSGTLNTAEIQRDILSDDSYCPHMYISYSAFRGTVSDSIKPKAVTKIPFTVNLVKLGKMSL